MGSRLWPSSYKVTSPSKVANWRVPYVVTAMIWAELRIRRTSLKDGETKRRDEMYRLRSWYLKAASSGSRVKNGPTLGTRSFSFEGKGFSASYWLETADLNHQHGALAIASGGAGVDLL